MLVGDNFYESGIHGSEYSSRFRDTFENAFPASHKELNIPFYAVAGNHDHGGNVTAQIEYSKHSSRWNFDDFCARIRLPHVLLSLLRHAEASPSSLGRETSRPHMHVHVCVCAPLHLQGTHSPRTPGASARR